MSKLFLISEMFNSFQYFSIFIFISIIISIRTVHRRKLYTLYSMHYTLSRIKLDAIHLVLILTVLCVLKHLTMPKVLLELKYSMKLGPMHSNPIFTSHKQSAFSIFVSFHSLFCFQSSSSRHHFDRAD